MPKLLAIKLPVFATAEDGLGALNDFLTKAVYFHSNANSPSKTAICANRAGETNFCFRPLTALRARSRLWFLKLQYGCDRKVTGRNLKMERGEKYV